MTSDQVVFCEHEGEPCWNSRAGRDSDGRAFCADHELEGRWR